ncbi:MAG: hypothetical protein HZA03_10195 [Nitrospinae bacterium]|nr:hypothetical protein [Nitrospinota bacterium]
MERMKTFESGAVRPRRALAAALCALVFSACGGSMHGTLTSNNKNVSIQLKFAAKKALENMETAAWDGIPGGGNCGNAKSSFAPEVNGLVEKINPYLAARAVTANAPLTASLLNNPPRGEEQIGVYLCAGLPRPAYTVHRAVFLSAGFIDALNGAAPGWGGEPAFRSALAFVLYHEIGHAALGHSAAALENGGGFGPPEEIEADQFAYDAMAAAGIGYAGVELAKYQAGAGQLAAARP